MAGQQGQSHEEAGKLAPAAAVRPTCAAGVPRRMDERVVEIENEDEAPARTQAQRAVSVET